MSPRMNRRCGWGRGLVDRRAEEQDGEEVVAMGRGWAREMMGIRLR